MRQAKLSELQDLVMRLVAERDDWCSRYSAAVASGPADPDLLPLGQDRSPPLHSDHGTDHMDTGNGETLITCGRGAGGARMGVGCLTPNGRGLGLTR